MPVTQIAIELIQVLFFGGSVATDKLAAIGEIEVQKAISVEVKPRCAAAHDLGKKVPIGDGVRVEREIDSAADCAFCKNWRRRGVLLA